jgi:hypothetical protein
MQQPRTDELNVLPAAGSKTRAFGVSMGLCAIMARARAAAGCSEAAGRGVLRPYTHCMQLISTKAGMRAVSTHAHVSCLHACVGAVQHA